MNITTAVVSELGERDGNDDAFGDAGLAAGRCVVVADGAGGQGGGAIAARITVETTMASLAATPAFDDSALVAAVDAASREVHRRQAEPALSRMSSTVVVLCLDCANAVAHWVHLGDSRLYHFHRGIGEQLTTDHSVLQSFRDAGVDLSSERTRNVLYAAVGAEGETRPVAQSMSGIKEGDAFLLCSDGVWNAVPLTEIEPLLAQADSVSEWVAAIASAVRSARQPRQDNYTAVGVWLGSPERITVIRV